MWDRIEPLRPDRGTPSVGAVRRTKRHERREEEQHEEEGRPGHGRPRPDEPPPEPGEGHVDVRA